MELYLQFVTSYLTTKLINLSQSLMATENLLFLLKYKHFASFLTSVTKLKCKTKRLVYPNSIDFHFKKL